MTDEELKNIITGAIKPKFNKFFNDGLMAGWDACIYEIDKLTSGLTSSKAIREVIKRKVAEAKSRDKKEGET